MCGPGVPFPGWGRAEGRGERPYQGIKKPPTMDTPKGGAQCVRWAAAAGGSPGKDSVALSLEAVKPQGK